MKTDYSNSNINTINDNSFNANISNNRPILGFLSNHNNDNQFVISYYQQDSSFEERKELTI